MEERKYLEDVPKDIQDLIFEGKFAEAFSAVGKGTDFSADEIDEKYREIVKCLHEKNPEMNPPGSRISSGKKGDNSTTPGCLLMLAAPVLWVIFHSLFKSSSLLEVISPFVVLLMLIIGAVGFVLYIANSNIDLNAGNVKCQQPAGPTEKSTLTKCKTCKADISKTAPTCPHCGENLPGVHIHCPKCNSSNISLEAKGYSLGKAAAGALVLGPGGLVVGLHGRKNMELRCLSCGKKWKPKSAR